MRFGFANARVNTITKKENLKMDDFTLISNMKEAERLTQTRKSFLDFIKLTVGKNNYLDVKLAKLSYDFAREEFNNLSAEAVRRGLIMI